MKTNRKRNLPPGVLPALIILCISFYLTGFITSSKPVDSIQVTGARAYVSSLMLYPSGGGNGVSAGPIIANAVFSETEKRATISLEGIPPGTYEKIQLTITGKPSSFFDATLQNLNSVVIFGKHNDMDFAYATDAVIQKDITLATPVTVGEDKILRLETSLDINSAFMEDGTVLNPMDKSTSYKIGHNLEKAFSDAFNNYGTR